MPNRQWAPGEPIPDPPCRVFARRPQATSLAAREPHEKRRLPEGTVGLGATFQDQA